MPLANILTRVATELGIALNNSSQRAFTISRINEAAAEMWNAFDLVNSLREQTFVITNENFVLALPSSIGTIRGIRKLLSTVKLDILDMRPRYAQHGSYLNGYKWRLLGKSPLHTYIDNASCLVFSQAKPAEEAYNITVVGQTPNSSSLSESVTMAEGEKQVMTTNNFIDVKSIVKSGPTSYDLTVFDVNGTELSFIPNNETSVLYLLCQILEGDSTSTSALSVDQYVEVLYKPTFVPFVNDADEFQAPGYDAAIAWRTLEMCYMSAGKTTEASYAREKVAQLLIDAVRNDNAGKELMLNFVERGYYSMFGYNPQEDQN